MGARLVLVARDARRAEATMARLRACAPAAAHGVHYADLSRISEMKRVAAEIAAAEPRIDLLVNNAGALFSARQVTADGLEKHFAVNHVAYMVLTQGLSERLLAAAPARVVSTASGAHHGARLDLADLQTAKGYNGVLAYQRSKLYNIMWTRELARRWAGKGVTVNCFHPGVATPAAETPAAFSPSGSASQAVRDLTRRGAHALIHLAIPDRQRHRRVFRESRLTAPNHDAENDRRRLWTRPCGCRDRLSGSGEGRYVQRATAGSAFRSSAPRPRGGGRLRPHDAAAMGCATSLTRLARSDAVVAIGNCLRKRSPTRVVSFMVGNK
jgi:NAD(P)-dependent dehydrogenase (short-subunit alcohol dehydrogenase family)